MSQPITWRNVEAPNLRYAMSGMDEVVQGVNSIFSGLRGELDSQNATVKQNWETGKKNNTAAAAAEIMKFQDPAKYQAALESGQLQGMIDGYGGQVDSDRIMQLMDGRLAALQQRQTAAQQFQDAQVERGQRDVVNGLQEALNRAETPAEVANIKQAIGIYQGSNMLNGAGANSLTGNANTRGTTLDTALRAKEKHQWDHEAQLEADKIARARLGIEQQNLSLNRERLQLERGNRNQQNQIAGINANADLLTAQNASMVQFLKDNPHANTLSRMNPKDVDGLAKALGVPSDTVNEAIAYMSTNPIMKNGKVMEPSVDMLTNALRAHGTDWKYLGNRNGDIRSHILSQVSDPLVAAEVADVRKRFGEMYLLGGRDATPPAQIPAGPAQPVPAAAAPLVPAPASATTRQGQSLEEWSAQNTPTAINIRQLEKQAERLQTGITERESQKDSITKRFGSKQFNQRQSLDQGKLGEIQSQIATLKASLAQPTPTPTAAPPSAVQALDNAAAKAPAPTQARQTKEGLAYDAGTFYMRGDRGVGFSPVFGQGTHVKVEDGDTLHIRNGGTTHKVRFFGVDAAETDKGKGGQFMAPEAKEFVAKAMASGKVEVVVTQNKPDKNGRRVGEVFVDGKSLNEELLRKGLVQIFDMKNGSMTSSQLQRYEAAQNQAMRDGVGRWAPGQIPTSPGLFRAIGEELKF